MHKDIESIIVRLLHKRRLAVKHQLKPGFVMHLLNNLKHLLITKGIDSQPSEIVPNKGSYQKHIKIQNRHYVKLYKLIYCSLANTRSRRFTNHQSNVD